jgi:hypothetical protein
VLTVVPLATFSSRFVYGAGFCGTSGLVFVLLILPSVLSVSLC